jgi:hypothetical protein
MRIIKQSINWRKLVFICLLGNLVTANAQDYQVPKPGFNMSDPTACKEILCSGAWILDKSFLEDSSITGHIINNGSPLGITLMHNNGTINTSPWAIVFRESEWIFYKNNTYKIIGQYTKYKAATNGIDAVVLVIRDTAIYGTWNINPTPGSSDYDDTAQYFMGDGYNVRIRRISIDRMHDKYNPSGIIIAENLKLVQNGVLMPHWEGQLSAFTDRATVISEPFLYDGDTHVIWLKIAVPIEDNAGGVSNH